MPKLTIVIPARNEEFLTKTVEDILSKTGEDTEIIVGLDGCDDYNVRSINDKRLSVVRAEQPLGQRAMTNFLVDLSEADYVMKVDAHCYFSDGFDKELLKDLDDKTMLVPLMMNLHAYNWVCSCGRKEPQGIEPLPCHEWKKEIVWQPRPKPQISNMYFDTSFNLQYCEKQSLDILSETMALSGSAWAVSRKLFHELGLSSEEFGSWGSQGVELGCKMWLSGNRLLSTRKCFYAHLFRDAYDFPYQRDMKQVGRNGQLVKDMFLNNKWDKQIHPFSWLIEKFKPLPEWHDDKGRALMEHIQKQADAFEPRA